MPHVQPYAQEKCTRLTVTTCTTTCSCNRVDNTNRVSTNIVTCMAICIATCIPHVQASHIHRHTCTSLAGARSAATCTYSRMDGHLCRYMYSHMYSDLYSRMYTACKATYIGTCTSILVAARTTTCTHSHIDSLLCRCMYTIVTCVATCSTTWKLHVQPSTKATEQEADVTTCALHFAHIHLYSLSRVGSPLD